MAKIIKFLSKNIWIFIILFSLPAAFTLLVPGYFGASDDMHIAWLYEMDAAIKLGQIPPRYIPDLSFGFGYPLFNFLFPLPFYIGEIFHTIGLSFVDSIKAVFFISIPVSAIFMYLLLKEFTSKSLSFLGAVIYVYTPYRATDIYVRGAIGEIVSFAIFPILILTIIKLTAVSNKFNYCWMGIGAISFASLILSHNIAAYMFLPFLILLMFLLVVFLPSERLKILTQILISFILGLLISSYFWIPAIVDSSLMKDDTVFNFIDHFPTLKQLITPYWGYGASVPGPYDGMSFFIGIANLLLIITGIILAIIFWKKYQFNKKIIIVWAAISILIAFFMMNNRSTFVWDNLPLISYFQFPWRFLMIITVMSSILVITLDRFKSYSYIFIIFSFLIIIFSVGNFRPQDFLGRTDSYFINRYIPVPVASKEYLTLEEEYLRLPRNILYRPNKNYPLVTAGTNQVEIIKTDGLNATFKIYSETGTTIDYFKYNFPGWEVKIDGQEAKIISGSPFSQISFSVPYGFHEVNVYFGETNFKKALDIVSLLSFLLAIYLAVRNLGRSAIINKDE